MARRDPINATDEEARQLARDLLRGVRYGALAVTLPERPVPYVARVAMIWADGTLLTLISTLSTHTSALTVNPACAALIDEPGKKGDPLTHPRMTLLGDAVEANKTAWKGHWLSAIPKAQLYYDFTDFLMFELVPSEVHLNGGFGKAYRLAPSDLT